MTAPNPALDRRQCEFAKLGFPRLARGRTAGKTVPIGFSARLRSAVILLCLATLVVIPVSRAQSLADPIPAFTSGARVLFQGDSITDGNRARDTDPNHILGHGYVFLIAAKYGAAFPDLKLEFLNRGITGNAVIDLEKRWKADALDLRPDILSILAGANDTFRNLPPGDYEAGLDRLLTQARKANPKVKLVLCEPFALPAGDRRKNWAAWWKSTSEQQKAVERLAAKFGAALVRTQQMFDQATLRAPAEYWLWDGVHPTYAGHQLLADQWERTVREFWPTP